MKRIGTRMILMGTALLTSPLMLFAEKVVNEEKPEAKSSVWTMPYIFIVLILGAVIWVLCQPTKRREKAKKDDF